MSGGKFSRQTIPARGSITTTDTVVANPEGAPGHERDERSALFLLFAANMVDERTFYETGQERDARFRYLIHRRAQSDPDWLASLIVFARDEMHMRSASLVAAIEYGVAGGKNRAQVLGGILRRADEPAEALAYYQKQYGRSYPSWLKRGVAQAVNRLYTERSFLKYDGSDQRWRFGDVVKLTHPDPKDIPPVTLFDDSAMNVEETNRAIEKTRLFYRFLRKQRYGDGFAWLRTLWENQESPAKQLQVLRSYDDLQRLEPAARRETILQPYGGAMLNAAGITWERLSSWTTMDAAAWEAVIPHMGYMALLRNLRNFEQAGINDEAAQLVATTLADPAEVRASRQFPYRFYSAYANRTSERYAHALETAVAHSLHNIPVFPGRTLIMVDVSRSMNAPTSEKSKVRWWEQAALFGLAMARRCEYADLYAYSQSSYRIDYQRPLLATIPTFGAWPGALQGTDTWDLTLAHHNGHERVVIITDEQQTPQYIDFSKFHGAQEQILQTARRLYTYNIGGYQVAHGQQGEKGSYALGGLSDAGFTMMQILERGADQNWSFLSRHITERTV